MHDVRYTYSHYLWQLFLWLLLLCRNAKISQLLFGCECPERAQCSADSTRQVLPQIYCYHLSRHGEAPSYLPSFSPVCVCLCKGGTSARRSNQLSLQNLNYHLIAVNAEGKRRFLCIPGSLLGCSVGVEQRLARQGSSAKGVLGLTLQFVLLNVRASSGCIFSGILFPNNSNNVSFLRPTGISGRTSKLPEQLSNA